MILIQFPNRETEINALAFLVGRLLEAMRDNWGRC